MDWVQWHRRYDTSQTLISRLELVQLHISNCLDKLPSGPIQVISVCAGDGRDLIGVVKDHCRKKDVNARLVELNSDLVKVGRVATLDAELAGQFEFLNCDATVSTAYEGIAPANLILLCGVFGNVRARDLPRLIGSLRCLCRSGAYVVWTHFLSGYGLLKIVLIRKLLCNAGFDEVRAKLSQVAMHAVGTHRYASMPQRLPESTKLFRFTGPNRIQLSRLIGRNVLRLPYHNCLALMSKFIDHRRFR